MAYCWAMKKAQILLGTSSWTADGWEGAFYPAGTKPQDFLPIYADHFNTVEIDSTFYRVPTPKTVEQWKDRTPDGFIFAAKVPQIITHEKVLVGAPAEDLYRSEQEASTGLAIIDTQSENEFGSGSVLVSSVRV